MLKRLVKILQFTHRDIVQGETETVIRNNIEYAVLNVNANVLQIGFSGPAPIDVDREYCFYINEQKMEMNSNGRYDFENAEGFQIEKFLLPLDIDFTLTYKVKSL